MNWPRRIRLNPCDYLYYAHHHLMVQSGKGGNVAFMMLEAEGHADPQRVRRALCNALLAHPTMMGRSRVSLFRGQPYWLLPGRGDAVRMAELAAVKAHVYEDVSGTADSMSGGDWQERVETLCQDRFVADWDIKEGPLVRLEQYALPQSRTRFCIRWPHSLMDAEGAQWFLNEIDRGDTTGEFNPLERPAGLLGDHEAVDPLRGMSVVRRLKLFHAGYQAQQESTGLRVRQLFHDQPCRFEDQRFLHRCWEPDQVAAMQANAKRWTPPGPGLYARYLAACVLRALHRIYTDHAVETDAYLITLPMRAGSMAPSFDATRPAPGNYLVATTLWARREMVGDRAALGAELLRLLESYARCQGDLAQWTMIWLTSQLRPWPYRMVLKAFSGLERYGSGFSYYGEIRQPVRRLVGTQVTNLWGCAPMALPPGWNPAFSKFGNRLNFSLAWVRPFISDELARRYAQLIELEAFDPC